MKPFAAILALGLCCGCASSIEVTRTTSEFHMPTNPGNVEILKVPPTRPNKQIADVSAMQYPNGESARMWSDIRTHAASVGADAVLITDEQTFRRDFILYRSVTGVALKWTQ